MATEQDRAVLEEKLRLMERTMQRKDEELEKYKANTTQLNEQIIRLSFREQEQIKKNCILEHEIEEWKMEKSNLEVKRIWLDGEKDRLLEEFKELHEEIISEKNKRIEIELQFQELRTQNNIKDLQARKFEGENSLMKEQIKALKEEREKLMESIQQIEASFNEKFLFMNKTEADREMELKEAGTFRKRLAPAITQIENLKKEMAEIQNSSTREIERLLSENEKLLNDKSKMSVELIELQSAKSAAETMIHKLTESTAQKAQEYSQKILDLIRELENKKVQEEEFAIREKELEDQRDLAQHELNKFTKKQKEIEDCLYEKYEIKLLKSIKL